MNRSGDLMPPSQSARDSLPQYHYPQDAISQQGLRHVHATSFHPRVSSAPRSILPVFNELVPTNCRVHQREEAQKPIGIMVATGVGGPSGHSNFVRVRLTDPADPFFLFQLDLLEDDYGKFKKDHQLRVDFAEFAGMFAGMLQEVLDQNASSGSGTVADRSSSTLGVERQVSFEVNSATSGQLFAQEVTRFKTTNMLELLMTREGDVGQKKYLAEQFDYFQAAFYDAEAQRKDMAIALERTIADLRRNLAATEAHRDQLVDKLKLDASEQDSKMQRVLRERQEEHASEIQKLRSSFDDERAALQSKLDALQTLYQSTGVSKDADLAALSGRVAALENLEVSLRSQLNVKSSTVDAQASELEHLRDQVRQLQEHRNSAQRALSESGITIVQLTERLTAAERTSVERSEETRVLRAQAKNDAETIRVLTDQLKERQSKLQELDSDLKKAHHIIANQLQAAKQAKERHSATTQQLQDARYLIESLQQKRAELDVTIERLNDEQHRLHDTISQLKDQLASLVDVNGKLEQDLKLARDAVVHVQRHGAHTLSRHIASISGAANTSPAADIYRQFAQSQSTAAGVTNNSTAPFSSSAFVPLSGAAPSGGGGFSRTSVAPTSAGSLGTAGWKMSQPSSISLSAAGSAAEPPTAYF